MRKWLNNYFDFTKREFNGLLALLMLILLISAVPYAYGLVKTDAAEDPADAGAIKKIFLAGSQTVSYTDKKPLTGGHIYKRKFSPFYFDPNKISIVEWQKLGLSAKQSLAIVRYVAKGGRFKKTEDLQKMYTISAEMYKRLAPYVEIAGAGSGKTVSFGPKYAEKHMDAGTKLSVEVNQADSTALDAIKGIGPVFASRIIKYRNRLGGFYKKEQLMEVFGLDSVKYNEIKDQIIIEAAYLKKININTAVPEDFKNHPYIRYKQVNAIVQYRKQHGNYSNIADLNKVAILTAETIARLAPYLTF